MYMTIAHAVKATVKYLAYFKKQLKITGYAINPKTIIAKRTLVSFIAISYCVAVSLFNTPSVKIKNA